MSLWLQFATRKRPGITSGYWLLYSKIVILWQGMQRAINFLDTFEGILRNDIDITRPCRLQLLNTPKHNSTFDCKLIIFHNQSILPQTERENHWDFSAQTTDQPVSELVSWQSACCCVAVCLGLSWITPDCVGRVANMSQTLFYFRSFIFNFKSLLHWHLLPKSNHKLGY